MKKSHKIQNTISQCFSSFEVKHVLQLKQVTSNTRSKMRQILLYVLRA